jgi:hypothetical protein
MVDKSKLGRRYACFQCDLKFYDLNRPEPFCPKCGADQREDPNPDPREAILAKFRGKGAPKPARAEDDPIDEEEGEDDVEVDEDDIDDEDEEREEPVEDE